ncbi:MAG TPA: hypothetical protein DCS93_37250 [Microscillaceae bacterium]|nr:hypothetical protein [Microscillaceae bacterium]
MNNFHCFMLWCCCIVTLATTTHAQDNRRSLYTSFTPLGFTPDARAAGLGNAGTATAPTANAIFWNPGKIVFNENRFGASLNYTTWDREFSSNTSHTSLATYYKLSDKQAISLSVRYFDYGRFEFFLPPTNALNSFRLADLSYSLAYSRKLGKNWGLGITGRLMHARSFINSTNITVVSLGSNSTSFAFDAGVFHQKSLSIAGKSAQWNLGLSIVNFGPKTSHTTNNFDNFIPITLRIGSALSTQLSSDSKLTWAVDISKLMVPTPPVINTQTGIINGQFPHQKPLLGGALGAFGDAPGGFSEEMQEIIWATGLEYQWKNRFSIRAGYHYEHENKGNQSYVTLGAGASAKNFSLDLSYLMNVEKNEFQPTERLRISLGYGI